MSVRVVCEPVDGRPGYVGVHAPLVSLRIQTTGRRSGPTVFSSPVPASSRFTGGSSGTPFLSVVKT